MNRVREDVGLRRVTGALLVVGVAAFALTATVLSMTFDWPDILREPPGVVLPAFVAGGTGLVWTWFATAWTYAILLVPILLLPTALGRRDDPALRAATFVGATSVSLIGFLRWVFVVPAAGRLLRDRRRHHAGGGARGANRTAPVRRRAARGTPRAAPRDRVVGHRRRGHPAHSRTAELGRVRGVAGQRALPAQPGRHSTAVPGFPVWDRAGLIGSTAWAVWVLALGVILLRRPGDRHGSGGALSAAAGPLIRTPTATPSAPAGATS